MSTPKYERVAADIREQIRGGELKPGARLPSTAQLIEKYKVSYGSIRTAILLLKAEGLIEGRQGEAIFVVDRGEDATRS